MGNVARLQYIGLGRYNEHYSVTVKLTTHITQLKS